MLIYNITIENIIIASQDAYSRREILKRLGVPLKTRYYLKLNKIAEDNKFQLPPPRKNKPVHGVTPTRRRSVVWDKEALAIAIEGSLSKKEVLQKLGLEIKNTKILEKAAKEYNSH